MCWLLWRLGSGHAVSHAMPEFSLFSGGSQRVGASIRSLPPFRGWGESGRGILPLVSATLRTHVIGYLLRVNGHDGLLGHLLWILKQR